MTILFINCLVYLARICVAVIPTTPLWHFTPRKKKCDLESIWEQLFVETKNVLRNDRPTTL